MASPRVAIVGPTHPFKGGIAQHTTRLAHQLEGIGMPTYIESWRRQYPARLYPGQLTVPEDQPEVPVFAHVRRRMSWSSPLSWLAAASRLRRADVVVFVVVNTPQLLIHHVLRLLLGGGPRVVALMHNVLPHEPGPLDRLAVTAFLRRADDVIVHSAEQQALAESLSSTPVTATPLPVLIEPPAPLPPRRRESVEEPLEVLSFGLVRPYKGVDVLVRAMAEVPQVRVTVAGEFWTPAEELQDLADRLGAGDRLRIRAGYVPSEEVPELFGACHLAALTYRSVTGSGNLKLAFETGRPVVASRVGSLEAEVGSDHGFLARPDDPADLAAALRRACDPAEYNRVAQAVASYPRGELEREWQDYGEAVRRMLDRPRG